MMLDYSYAEILLQIILALIIGGILGLERGARSRPAGLRTYMLVCLGSCLVMMTNMYIFRTYGVSDPVRMGAQVISGIGFLGAGTIIMTGTNRIRGITTAADLWTSACCGLAIGSGFYFGAIVGSAAVFLVMTLMRGFDRIIQKRSRYIELYIELKDHYNFDALFNFLFKNSYEIEGLEFLSAKSEETVQSAAISLKTKIKKSHEEMILEIKNFEGTKFCRETGTYQ